VIPEPTGGSPSAGAGGTAEPVARSVWFSEYVEGSGNNKALEIASATPVSLAGCRVEVFANGNAEKPSASWGLDAEISSDTPWVLCTKALSMTLGGVCRQEAGLAFNGDDAVVLRCDGALMDVIGQIGVQPEARWGTPELGTLDLTLRRACSVSTGDRDGTDAFEPSVEWTAAAADAFDDLGVHCVALPLP
jgi:predicted extracellular nuclease